MPFRVWSDTGKHQQFIDYGKLPVFDRQFIDLCSSALILQYPAVQQSIHQAFVHR